MTSRELAARLGRTGVWLGSIGMLPAADERRAVKEIESLGFSAVWFGESATNREALAHAATLLSWTKHLVVATGIASIWARDATAAANGAAALADAYPGRFVLGLGVSHAHLVAARGEQYASPVDRMRAYLEAMDAATYAPPPPTESAPRLLGALHPVMLELARERTSGAHPYLVPVAHTALARDALGPDPVLAPELGVAVAGDAAEGRAVARDHLRYYLGAPNYVRNWQRLGFGEADVGGEGSDRLVDELIAWGTPEQIGERVEAHRASGADHVAVQALGADPLGQLRALASAIV
jgi:probable F420-dependent oxidoreductase